MAVLLVVCALLALLPAVNTFMNLRLLRRPPAAAGRPRVAILVPARDEEGNIGACIDAALASEGVELEVIVLNDGSTDGTADIVASRAARDPRLRLEAAPPLPVGWGGKPHACHALAGMTDSPFLLFIDADVRVSPDAAVRLVPPPGIDLTSGVPRQQVRGVVEAAVVPMINSLIYGYLPVGLMRQRPDPSLAAACGQMIMARASAYHACGGHGAIRTTRHDGLQLPRSFRRAGFVTDLVDGTPLAVCRMYDGAAAVMAGFGKNATEGMARPLALPLWTVFLLGGHLLPVPLLVAALASRGLTIPSAFLLFATLLLALARIAQGRRCQEGWKPVALHPVGVAITLFIQWTALVRAFRGTPIEWRGRTYVADKA